MNGPTPAQNAASTLSSVGAGIAGAGLGVLLAPKIGAAAVPILVVGLIAHAVGMMGAHRLQAAAGYKPERWELLAYWGCWVLIIMVIIYGVFWSG